MLPKVSYPIGISQKTTPTEIAACSCCSPAASVTIPTVAVPDKSPGAWRRIRGAVMFGIACLTSPCCTPLLVPLVIALLAGTPAALWMSAHLGWIFGGLTLISAVSFVLGWRWLGSKVQPTQSVAQVSNVTFDSNYPKILGGILMSEQENLVIACDLSAINAAERDQHMLTGKQLFASVTEVQELADGYAFRLPSENLTLRSAANFIANERLCCPFFDFTLKVGAQGGLWLSLTGSDEVKQFVRVEFGTLVKVSLGT